MNREKEIEKASVEYQMSKKPMVLGGGAFADIAYIMNINPSFVEGAKWADKTMIDKAVEWLKANFNMPDDFELHFRKAME